MSPSKPKSMNRSERELLARGAVSVIRKRIGQYPACPACPVCQEREWAAQVDDFGLVCSEHSLSARRFLALTCQNLGSPGLRADSGFDGRIKWVQLSL